MIFHLIAVLIMVKWVDTEYSSLNFGDARLNKRGKTVLSHFIEKPPSSIPQSCKGWSETHAAYRFFNNPKVTIEKVLSPHIHATVERMRNYNVVLLIQDTTEFDFTGKKVKGSGPLCYDDMTGFLCHPSIVITPDRLCLGVVDANIWSRDPKTFHMKKERKNKPIEEKESYHWVEGYKKANSFSEHLAHTQVVSIADREGDIYECFVEACNHHSPKGADWIIRSCQNRSLPDKVAGEKYKFKKIWDTVASINGLVNSVSCIPYR